MKTQNHSAELTLCVADSTRREPMNVSISNYILMLLNYLFQCREIIKLGHKMSLPYKMQYHLCSIINLNGPFWPITFEL